MKCNLRIYKIHILILICRLVEKRKTFTLWKYKSKRHEHIVYAFKKDQWHICFYYIDALSGKKNTIPTSDIYHTWNVINSALDYVTFNYILLNHEKLGPENIVDKIKTIRKAEDFIKERLHL